MKTCLLASAVLGLILSARAQGLPPMGADMAKVRLQAEQGDVRSERLIGDQHYGWNPAEAVAWYRKAAENGDAESQRKLGSILLCGSFSLTKGHGVEADTEAGLQWLFKACLQGDEFAALELGKAYENGVGVDRDNSEAFKFYRVASAKNSTFVGFHINLLSAKMTAEEIREGERRAEEFQRTPAEKRTLKKPSLAAKLVLQGLILGPRPMATINGRTLEAGESLNLKINGHPFRLHCDKIEAGGVTVTVTETGEKLRLQSR